MFSSSSSSSSSGSHHSGFPRPSLFTLPMICISQVDVDDWSVVMLPSSQLLPLSKLRGRGETFYDERLGQKIRTGERKAGTVVVRSIC